MYRHFLCNETFTALTFLNARAGTGEDLVLTRYSSQVKPSISGQSAINGIIIKSEIFLIIILDVSVFVQKKRPCKTRYSFVNILAVKSRRMSKIGKYNGH